MDIIYNIKNKMQYQPRNSLYSIILFIFTITNMYVLSESNGSGGWPSTTGNPSGGGRNNGLR